MAPLSKMLSLVLVCLVLVHIDLLSAVENDTFWLSRYDYDYKMLHKIVVMEQAQNNLKQLLDQQGNLIRQQQQMIEKLETDHTGSLRNLQEQIRDITMDTSSTYVRWGRTGCPGNGTEMVYKGYTAGSHYTYSGGAVNPLCLPEDPLWGEYDDSLYGHSYIFGTEYEFASTSTKMPFTRSLFEHDSPCAVCRSSRSSLVMIPGRNACYDGWTPEYTGYIVAGANSHVSASEYLCLDGDSEAIDGGVANKNGKLLYITEAYCGSLKCPPYVHGRELTCVVCTK